MALKMNSAKEVIIWMWKRGKFKNRKKLLDICGFICGSAVDVELHQIRSIICDQNPVHHIHEFSVNGNENVHYTIESIIFR